MSTTREKPLSDRAIALVKKRGGKLRKVLSNGDTGGGWPDCEGGYRGRHIVIESKSPTGKLHGLQPHTLYDYYRAGSYVCILANDLSHLVTMLDRIDKEIDFGSRGA